MTEFDPEVPRESLFAEPAVRELVRLVRGVAFWSGVGLPVVYLPLVVGGFADVGLRTFVALVAANYVALLAGAGYGRSRSGD